MPPKRAAQGALTPNKAIRRFDVFAEYSRQERREKGAAEDEAKGYGIWLAKVVAARRFGRSGGAAGSARLAGRGAGEAAAEEAEPTFRSVGDELQTDETFDREVVERMGAGFYADVFVPAITGARSRGEAYEAIRDEIRKGWKPAKAAKPGKAASR